MNGYTLVAQRLYFPVIDLVHRSPFRRALLEAEANQRRPLSELRRLQLEKMRRIASHSQEHCDYYRDTFRRANVKPQELRSLDDWRRVPLLSKGDVFEHGRRMVSADHVGRLMAASTSGSTGMSLRFMIDSEQYGWVEACQWRGRHWWGLERGETQLLLWSRPVDRNPVVQLRSWAKYRLRNYIQFDTFQDFDESKVDAIIDAIRRHRPSLIYGYGSSIARIADRLDRRGETLEDSARPRLIEYTADHMYEAERILAARVFGAPVVSAYGASECGGVAQQCREGNLHVSIDHAVVEFLRPDGTPAAEGEVGEIVLTTLHNRGMPLLRYRIDDLGVWLDEPCGCGVTLPVMKLAAGKAVDLISTSTKQAVSAHVLDYINLHLIKHDVRGVRQYLVEQHELDRFKLTIVREMPFDPRCTTLFVQLMREYLGAQIDVEVAFADQLPRQPSGKRRYFKRLF